MFKVGDIIVAKSESEVFGTVIEVGPDSIVLQWNDELDNSRWRKSGVWNKYWRLATKLDKYLLGINDDTISDT